GFRNAFDHLFGDFRFQLARGQVVHEKHRGGALHDNVVDAVVDQVSAHGVVNVHFKRHLKLRAHAVDTGNQDGILVLQRNRKHTSKAANLAQDALGERFVGQVQIGRASCRERGEV